MIYLLKQWVTVEKRGEEGNTKIFNILRTKSLFRWNKKYFWRFLRVIIWWKKEKIADRSFNFMFRFRIFWFIGKLTLIILMPSYVPVHCVKSVHIRSYSGLHFSRIFPHSDWMFSPNGEKCGKNAVQNNSEYGHLLRSGKW